jgi:hypothetical protein
MHTAHSDQNAPSPFLHVMSRRVAYPLEDLSNINTEQEQGLCFGFCVRML